MTPSTPLRSASACQSGTPSPPISSTARRASRSSSEPGNVTTPMRALTLRGAPGSASPRSPGSRAAGRPSPRPGSAPPTRSRPPARVARACPSAPRTRCANPVWGGRFRPPCPAGPRVPASGSRAPRRRTSSALLPETLERRVVVARWRSRVGREERTGDALIGLRVARRRARDHLGREPRCRWLVIPAGRIQPIAHELLVERRLGAARHVAVGRPEPGGVGRPYLVDQDQVPVREAELELRVREDDAAGCRRVGETVVDPEGELLQPFEQTLADEVDPLLGSERQVVARIRFAGRREDRYGEA